MMTNFFQWIMSYEIILRWKEKSKILKSSTVDKRFQSIYKRMSCYCLKYRRKRKYKPKIVKKKKEEQCSVR